MPLVQPILLTESCRQPGRVGPIRCGSSARSWAACLGRGDAGGEIVADLGEAVLLGG